MYSQSTRWPELCLFTCKCKFNKGLSYLLPISDSIATKWAVFVKTEKKKEKYCILRWFFTQPFVQRPPGKNFLVTFWQLSLKLYVLGPKKKDLIIVKVLKTDPKWGKILIFLLHL